MIVEDPFDGKEAQFDLGRLEYPSRSPSPVRGLARSLEEIRAVAEADEEELIYLEDDVQLD